MSKTEWSVPAGDNELSEDELVTRYIQWRHFETEVRHWQVPD